jgi:hypothetical protein
MNYYTKKIHNALCHWDGSVCQDGCDKLAHPKLAELYQNGASLNQLLGEGVNLHLDQMAQAIGFDHFLGWD